MFKGTLKKLLMMALMTTIVIGGVAVGSKEVKASEVEPRELEETEHGNCGAVDGSVKTGGYIDVLSNNEYYIYEKIYYSFNNGVLTIDGRSDTELTRWQKRYNRIWAGYFEGYTNIEKVVINVDGIRLSKDAFKGCTNLTSVIIMPKVIDGFGTSTFEGCTSLKSVIFPNGCYLSDPGIDENCFKDCTSLTSIELPSNSLQLNPGVFQNCRSLKTLVFGQTVELLRKPDAPDAPNAFQGCDNITTIVIKNKNSIWGRNEDENYDLNIERIKKIIESATSANSNFSTIKIPEEYVDVIKEYVEENYHDSNITVEKYVEPVIPSKETETESESEPEQEIASEGTPKGPSKSIYEQRMDDLIKELNLASADAGKTGTVKTVYLKDVTSLSLSAMKALKDAPNVILDMTYTYKGVGFHVVIPGGSLIYTDESIPWYGPVWLYTYYGQGALTNASGNASNVYVVQSGDTLRKIAAKLSLSIDELIKKNPQIKNVEKISIGDKVNY